MNTHYYKLIFNIKFLFVSTFFFLLLYYDQTQIFGLKISHIWKVVFILGTLVFCGKEIGKYGSIMLVSLLLVIKLILNTSFPNGIMSDLTNALSFLFLPTSILIFSKMRNYSKIDDFLFQIACFFILSTLPFHLGIIKQNTPEISLKRFGAEDSNLFSGLFYHPAVASQVYVACFLFLLNDYRKYKGNILILFIMALGIFSVFKCFTRTGWAALIIGILFVFFYKKSIFQIIKYIPFIIIIFILLNSFISNNKYIKNRLTDSSIYQEEDDNFELDPEKLGSGRILFWTVAIENIRSEGSATFLMGYGKEYGMDKMDKKLNLSIVAHNALIEVLEIGGLIGVILLLFYYYLNYSYVFKKIPMDHHMEFEMKRFGYVLFILLIIFTFFSHGNPVYVDIFAGATIVKLKTYS